MSTSAPEFTGGYDPTYYRLATERARQAYESRDRYCQDLQRLDAQAAGVEFGEGVLAVGRADQRDAIHDAWIAAARTKEAEDSDEEEKS